MESHLARMSSQPVQWPSVDNFLQKTFRRCEAYRVLDCHSVLYLVVAPREAILKFEPHRLHRLGCTCRQIDQMGSKAATRSSLHVRYASARHAGDCACRDASFAVTPLVVGFCLSSSFEAVAAELLQCLLAISSQRRDAWDFLFI